MLEFNLVISKQNLEVLAKLKRQALCLNISLKQVLKYYFDSLKLINQRKQVYINGESLYYELQDITNHKPHKSTVIRWFKFVPPIDGVRFDRNRKYESSELPLVYLSAFLYNARKTKTKKKTAQK